MPTTPERLAALEKMTAEIHLAVVGNGSAGSSLRERVSKLETQSNWLNKGIYSVLPAVATALLAHIGFQLHPGGPS